MAAKSRAFQERIRPESHALNAVDFFEHSYPMIFTPVVPISEHWISGDPIEQLG
jgi:hypothetical protein